MMTKHSVVYVRIDIALQASLKIFALTIDQSPLYLEERELNELQDR